MEHPRSSYLDDFLETIDRWEERETATLHIDNPGPADLSLLNADDWSRIRTETLQQFRRLGFEPDALVIPSLYLSPESWDGFFGWAEVAMQNEGYPDAMASSHVATIQAATLESVAAAHQREHRSFPIRAKADAARAAAKEWCDGK